MIKTIIDTDPGTDDALAIMMAMSSPDLDVLGITTVGGNATLAHTTRNALRLMEYLGTTDVPVCQGAARPLKGKYAYAYHFHGPAGLGVRLPAPRIRPHPVSAPEFIAQAASSNRGELVLIALGPLTNVARALAEEPRLAEWVKEMVIMGGAMEVPGNVTRYAEFNIFNDALAADVVLSSGIPTTLVGLDVCVRTAAAREESPWLPGGSRPARLARKVLANWFRSHPGIDRYDLCDPLAIVAAVQPDLLGYRRARVSVVTEVPAELGRTVGCYDAGHVRVATQVDAEGSKRLIARLLNASRWGVRPSKPS